MKAALSGAGEESPGESERIAEDFRDFCYTKENIGCNAFCQRYRVYEEDGDSEGYEFSFSSFGTLKEFEAWCRKPAEQKR